MARSANERLKRLWKGSLAFRLGCLLLVGALPFLGALSTGRLFEKEDPYTVEVGDRKYAFPLEQIEMPGTHGVLLLGQYPDFKARPPHRIQDGWGEDIRVLFETRAAVGLDFDRRLEVYLSRSKPYHRGAETFGLSAYIADNQNDDRGLVNDDVFTEPGDDGHLRTVITCTKRGDPVFIHPGCSEQMLMLQGYVDASFSLDLLPHWREIRTIVEKFLLEHSKMR